MAEEQEKEEVIHYHGTPITPRSVLQSLAGKNFCVSYARPDDVKECHRIGQSIMLDNGAWDQYMRNPKAPMYVWGGFYEWAKLWLNYQTSWAVIPDVIGGSEETNDQLIDETLRKLWYLKRQIAPVWHIHESIDRLQRLMAAYDTVCFGSSGEFFKIGNASWNNRMNDVFNQICPGSGKPPVRIHMLRGMSLCGSDYPFYSVDSSDVARHHYREGNAREMADRWDAIQNPACWRYKPVQATLETETMENPHA